ncbi:hypothetical protein Cantr_01235 [Candida viswanathii]|uniref:Uncharacterized protein n=1 Tax=Candida viswanathii TaxID=5486 RepID=A0A367YKK6_9ASCO|nr:hypothetical protein Cantr_01235 [Candida viswanathii]
MDKTSREARWTPQRHRHRQDTEDDTDYQTDTDDEDNNLSPSADDISYSIFSLTGGNLTTIKYPCYSMEETFENHTLWTLNIGRAILCGIQNPQADVLIVESKQREAEMSTASRMGSSATATRMGH